jgi:hypothetical protein
MMPTIDSLFGCDPLSQYQKMEDSFFTNASSFMLEQMYCFPFNSDSKIYKLYDLTRYQISREFTDASILKLSGHFYLISINWLNVYQSKRGDFYELKIDEEKLMQFFKKEHIKNEINLPIEVNFITSSSEHEQGFYMYSNLLEKKSINALARFITIKPDNPDALIDFFKHNYLKVFELLEKEHLETQMSEAHSINKKVKI